MGDRKRGKNTVRHDYWRELSGIQKDLAAKAARGPRPPANWREFASHDSVSAGLDRSSIFADWDDGNSGEKSRVVGHSQNSLGMLLGFFLTYKPLGGARDEFRGYEIDPVISHAIFLSGGIDGMASFDEAASHRQLFGKGVHR